MKKIKEVKVNEVEYVFNLPNIGTTSKADMVYSLAYTDALKAGLMPRTALEDLLKQQGIDFSKIDETINTITESMQEFLLKIRGEKDLAKREELRASLYDYQSQMMQLTAKRQALFVNTVESKAEEAKIAELIWTCIFKKEGGRAWSSKDEFLKEENTNEISELIKQFIMFINGIEFTENDINNLFEEQTEEKEEVKEEAKEEVKTEVPA